jgi:hypothetical protein
LDNAPPDLDPDAGEFKLDGLYLGRYTIEETMPPAGYSGDPWVETVELTLSSPDGSSGYIWINTPNLGCTPGFWNGGAGSLLWDEISDGAPYIHTTPFNDFFDVLTDPLLTGTMWDYVSGGGGSNWNEKAARDMVAAYLNETFFAGYPAASTADLLTMWYAAVAAGDPGYQAFHELVGGWNDPAPPGYCPLP